MSYSHFQLRAFVRASRVTTIGTIAAASFALAACTATPTKPDGADAVRAELTRLQTDPKLASRAPVALQDAEFAVREAETPTDNVADGTQRVYVAQRKVGIARAQAEKRYAEDQVKVLGEQRESSRLDARTQEAESAKSQAEAAKAQAMSSQSQAEQAIAIAQQQQAAAAAARSEADALRHQMEELQAKQTDRGLVMTLGDVLFATGKAELQPGAAARLDKLADFMTKYADRSLVIEGHTDNVGSNAANEVLSQRRADAVKAYLMVKGINSSRLQAVGKGKAVPVTDNSTASGRQQNRRVEVIISNPGK